MAAHAAILPAARAHRQKNRNLLIAYDRALTPAPFRHTAQNAAAPVSTRSKRRVGPPEELTALAQSSFQRTTRHFCLRQAKKDMPIGPRAAIKHSRRRVQQSVLKRIPPERFLYATHLVPCSQSHYLRQKAARACQRNFGRLPPEKHPRDTSKVLI